MGSGVGLTTTNKGGSGKLGGCSCAVDNSSSRLLAGDELSAMITGNMAGGSVLPRPFDKLGPKEESPSSASGVGSDCGGPTFSVADVMVCRMLATKWDKGLDKGRDTEDNARRLPYCVGGDSTGRVGPLLKPEPRDIKEGTGAEGNSSQRILPTFTGDDAFLKLFLRVEENGL